MTTVQKSNMSSALAQLVLDLRDETLQQFARDITIQPRSHVAFKISDRHKDICKAVEDECGV